MRKGREDRKSGRKNTGDANKNRLFINVGKMDGFENKGQLLGFICNQSGINGGSVGKIDLFDSFAFIGVDDGVGEKLISQMDGKNIENRDIRVEFSNDKPKGGGGARNRGGNRSDRGRNRSEGGYKGGNRNFKERRKRR